MERRAAVLSAILACVAAHASFARADGADTISLQAPDGAALVLAVGPDAPPLLLHFWATWCPDCAAELPRLDARLAACDGTPVRAYLVNVGEPAAAAQAFLAARGVRAPLALDPSGAVWRRLAPQGLPANAFFREGELHRAAGALDADAWARRLAALGCRGASPDEAVR
ncbi:MAG TPA: TlpA disulfide reductase family protein [Myxococcota bacterium]|jgi:peroxiredoxin|nr:TlpA disulfide reductase family protein [Myxococcota bacterium]